jgi:hypothetical protein
MNLFNIPVYSVSVGCIPVRHVKTVHRSRKSLEFSFPLLTGRWMMVAAFTTPSIHVENSGIDGYTTMGVGWTHWLSFTPTY